MAGSARARGRLDSGRRCALPCSPSRSRDTDSCPRRPRPAPPSSGFRRPRASAARCCRRRGEAAAACRERRSPARLGGPRARASAGNSLAGPSLRGEGGWRCGEPRRPRVAGGVGASGDRPSAHLPTRRRRGAASSGATGRSTPAPFGEGGGAPGGRRAAPRDPLFNGRELGRSRGRQGRRAPRSLSFSYKRVWKVLLFYLRRISEIPFYPPHKQQPNKTGADVVWGKGRW